MFQHRICHKHGPVALVKRGHKVSPSISLQIIYHLGRFCFPTTQRKDIRQIILRKFFKNGITKLYSIVTDRSKRIIQIFPFCNHIIELPECHALLRFLQRRLSKGPHQHIHSQPGSQKHTCHSSCHKTPAFQPLLPLPSKSFLNRRPDKDHKTQKACCHYNRKHPIDLNKVYINSQKRCPRPENRYISSPFSPFQ